MSAYGHPQPSGRDEYDGYDSYEGYGDSYAPDPYANGSYAADPYAADAYAAGSHDRYAEPTRAGGPGRAAGWAGTAGRATPPTSPATGSAAVAAAGGAAAGGAVAGRASAGRARVAARASVASASAPVIPHETEPEPTHRYDWAGAGAQKPAGRATVPVSPAVGGASGRARVRPGGPGGPDGPAGSGPGGPADERPKKKKKRHRIRNTILIVLAVMVIGAGGGMVALSYYVESVPPPELIDLAEGSTVFYADGREMAVLQDVNREIIDTTVPELANARNAVVAAEDKGFFEHSGVDFMGIMRAAFNNFTGGEQQGASTIDQQYAGAAADIRGDSSYSRKLREAAMAYKMNQDYSKEEILDFYLNTIYMGRGAHGIQAAAEAYFDKPAAELTFEEAALIAGCIRLPDDGSGLCPYDPMHSPEETETPELRFRYVLGQAVEMGTIDQATADAMVLPEVVEPADPDEPFRGAQGNIVRHVQRELEEMGITDVATGGYRITTTIDRDLQKAARDAARNDSEAPAYWDSIPEEIVSGLVSIDPNTGGVLAYYGGDDGTGFDHAGPNYDPETGELTGGGREPGSTMKIYTLIAALREGVSFDTHWQTAEYAPPWRPENPVRNAGRRAEETGCEGQAPDFCTLRWSTVQSYNTPFMHLAEAMGDDGPQQIIQAAMDAGVRTMTDGDGVTHDLTAIEDAGEVAPDPFFYEVAIGQYPITVLDHASGVATLAARGVYHEPHFVASVEQKVDGEWVPVAGDRISGEQRIEPQYADAITDVLTDVPGQAMAGNVLVDNRPAAAKTGTWEHGADALKNKDAWVVGYTPQIATAVWVGDPSGDPIVDEFGNNIGSSGLPAQIWKQFMDEAHAEMEWEIEQFTPPPPNGVGDPNHPFANGVQRQQEPPESDDPRCQGPFQPFCPDDDDDDEDNGGGDDDGGNATGGLLPINPPPGPGG